MNLAVYGWAQRHIFAESQHAAEEVRKAAKRSPRSVAGPQPFRQHVLIERDPHDDSVAKAHRKVGRAPYVDHLGETFDCVIALALSKAQGHRPCGHD